MPAISRKMCTFVPGTPHENVWDIRKTPHENVWHTPKSRHENVWETHKTPHENVGAVCVSINKYDCYVQTED